MRGKDASPGASIYHYFPRVIPTNSHSSHLVRCIYFDQGELLEHDESRLPGDRDIVARVQYIQYVNLSYITNPTLKSRFILQVHYSKYCRRTTVVSSLIDIRSRLTRIICHSFPVIQTTGVHTPKSRAARRT